MKIKILAETPQAKGKSFERLMVTILDHLGYTDSRTRIRKTGMELDIKAKHKVSNEGILCECKAHEEQVASRDLVNFLGKLAHERSKNQSLKGMFFSLSGFDGTALEWYEELGAKEKESFVIFGNEEVLNLLRKSGLLTSEEELDRIIKSHTKYPPGERYLVYFESTLYVVQLFLINGKSSRYVILTEKGNLAYKAICEEIAKLDETIRSLPIVNLQILDKVALNLLDLKKKTPDEIATDVVETVNDVKVALEELKTERLVLEDGKASKIFMISTELPALTELTKRFTNSEYKYTFMSSAYVESVINDTFTSYVSDRFKLNLDTEQRTVLAKASKIFPSVLSTLLLANTEHYETNYRHLQELGLPQSEIEKWQKNTVYTFMHEILLGILNDLQTVEGNYLAKKGVKGYVLKNKFKIASEFELIFASESEGYIHLAEAGGPIKSGQLVSYTDIALMLHVGNTLLALEEYERAIQEFKRIIKESTNPDLLKAAWNNKGLCYIGMKNYEQALSCFETALSHDNTLVEAWNNKARCLEALGRTEEARQARENAEKLKRNK